MNKAVILILFFIGAKAGAQSSALNLSDSLAAVGKYTQAIDLLEKVNQKNDAIYLKLARLQQSSGQEEASLGNYRKVLERNPRRLLTAIDYGELLYETGRLEKADSLFSSLSQKFPENAGFAYRLGLVKEKKKDSTAYKYFFKTISLDFTHQGALYKTSKHQLQNGKHSNAIELSSTGLKARPNNVSLLSILAQAYSVSLQFEKAIPVYERLLDLGEGSEFILEKLAKAYRVTSQPEKAIQAYQKMLEINDANSAVHSNLGILLLNTNKPKEAQLHFTMALLIKKQPIDKEYLYIGLTFKRLENFKEAYINFKKALEENPENERAHIEMAISADAYFDDKEAVLKLYEDFKDRYAERGRKDMLSIAEYRISELKKEIHLAK